MNDQEIREAVERTEEYYYNKHDAVWKERKILLDLAKEALAIKGSGVLPEKKEHLNTLVGHCYKVDGWNECRDKTTLKLAKFLSGLQKKIGELLYYRICEDGVSINLPPDMPEKRYCNFLAKAITDHIKRELLGLNKNEKSLDK